MKGNTMKVKYSEDLDDMQCSDDYAKYLMTRCERPICDADDLTLAMEEGYLFDEYLTSIGVENGVYFG